MEHFSQLNSKATRAHVVAAYLGHLAMVLSGVHVMCPPFSPGHRACFGAYATGHGAHKTFGVSMAGIARMHSLGKMIERLDARGLNGSYAETGVWRGGMSIYATAAFQVYYGQNSHQRRIYLCDSFQGLPAPRAGSYRARSDSVYKKQRLGVGGDATVLRNFDQHGVNRSQVETVVGFFVKSMPPFRESLIQRGERLAILRLDGDMYDSTVDVLYSLYDLVQVGGYVIIDDFGWTTKLSFGARDAIMDFRMIHGIEDDAHAIRNIDFGGAWFYKAREVNLRRDLYQASLSSEAKGLRQAMLRDTGVKLSGPAFGNLMKQWRTQWTAEEESDHLRAEEWMKAIDNKTSF